MDNRTLVKVTDSLKKRRGRKRWHKAVGIMGLAVLVATVTALVLPASTLAKEPVCGLSEHVHTESCYTETPVLSCGMEETDAHSHTDACYGESSSLVCGLEESEEHSHTDSCFGTERTLICQAPETRGHTHSGACYTMEQMLSCKETEHTHGEDCYEQKKAREDASLEEVSASDPEETALPQSDPTADVESRTDWERTVSGVTLTGNWAEDVLAVADSQLGYQESSRNFITDENGKQKGYSRYGAWYGDAYGDWCAMFASFCLHYADIPTDRMPQEASCPRWIYLLASEKRYASAGKYDPQPGDLIFFDGDRDGISDHVGIVYAVDAAKGKLKTVEGNSDDMVQYVTYQLGDERILGYGILPENPEKARPAASGRSYYYEDDTIGAAVTLPEDTDVPADARLRVTAITEKNDDYETLTKQAESAVEGETSEIALYDISFYTEDDEYIAVSDRAQVALWFKETLNAEADQSVSVLHFDESAETPVPLDQVKATKDMDDNVSFVTFETPGFSVFAVVTVGSGSSGDVNVNNLDGKSFAIAYLNGSRVALCSNNGEIEYAAVEQKTAGGVTYVNGKDLTKWTFKSTGSSGKYRIKSNTGYLQVQTKTENWRTIYSLGLTTSSDNATVFTVAANNGAVSLYGNNRYITWNSGEFTVAAKAADLTLCQTSDYNDWECTVSFNLNGGSGTTPQSMGARLGESIELPACSASKTNTKGNNMVFVGWSADKAAADVGAVHFRNAVYQPGEPYTVQVTETLYAIWAEQNVDAGFFIRLDGEIPAEPALANSTNQANYTNGVKIEKALKEAKFYANQSGVDDNLNKGCTPTAKQIAEMLNEKSKTLGFAVEAVDDEVIVKTAEPDNSYNVAVNDKLYVRWYVVKNSGDGMAVGAAGTLGITWHVDGVLLVKDRINLVYGAGDAPSGSVKNLPSGSQWPKKTTVRAGQNGQTETVLTPFRTDGYVFTGWKAYHKDTDGNYDYNNCVASYNAGQEFKLDQDTMLVAQWEKATALIRLKKISTDGKALSGAEFTLTASNEETETLWTSTDGVAIAGINRYLNTKYTLEETKAPDGYAMREPVIFEVKKDGDKYPVQFGDDGKSKEPEWVEIFVDDSGDYPVVMVQIKDEVTKTNLTIEKVDEEGKTLEGAEFKLYSTNGTVEDDVITEVELELYFTGKTVKTGANGTVVIPDLPYGSAANVEYALVETKAPTGAVKYAENIWLGMLDEDTTAEGKYSFNAKEKKVTVTNYKTVTIQVEKIWDGPEGDSVTMELYRKAENNPDGYRHMDLDMVIHPDADGKWIGTWVVPLCDDDNNLLDYCVREVPVDGYSTSYKDAKRTAVAADTNAAVVDLTDVRDGKTAVVKVTVTNTAGRELPHTGGAGTLWFTFGGLALLMMAIYIFIKPRRRREAD